MAHIIDFDKKKKEFSKKSFQKEEQKRKEVLQLILQQAEKLNW